MRLRSLALGGSLLVTVVLARPRNPLIWISGSVRCSGCWMKSAWPEPLVTAVVPASRL